MPTTTHPMPNSMTLDRQPMEWEQVTKEGATIQVWTAEVPDVTRRLVAQALQLGKAATNTTVKTPA